MGNHLGTFPPSTEHEHGDVLRTLRKLYGAGLPAPGNRCTEERCNGLVVQKCIRIGVFGPVYGIPECAKCGRWYVDADRSEVPKVGAQYLRRRHDELFA